MKKIIASAMLLFAFANVTNAQTLNFGGKAGANLTKVTGKAFKEEFDLGYHLGAFAEIGLNNKWAIQPEVLWNQINTKRASTTDQVINGWQQNSGDIKLQYLSIPILLNYKVAPLLTLNLGPQFGILMDQDKTLWNNGQEAFKSGDFSLVGGATINVKMLRVYGRYNIGLSDIKDVDNQDKWKSQTLQLGVGIRL